MFSLSNDRLKLQQILDILYSKDSQLNKQMKIEKYQLYLQKNVLLNKISTSPFYYLLFTLNLMTIWLSSKSNWNKWDQNDLIFVNNKETENLKLEYILCKIEHEFIENIKFKKKVFKRIK